MLNKLFQQDQMLQFLSAQIWLLMLILIVTAQQQWEFMHTSHKLLKLEFINQFLITTFTKMIAVSIIHILKNLCLSSMQNLNIRVPHLMQHTKHNICSQIWEKTNLTDYIIQKLQLLETQTSTSIHTLTQQSKTDIVRLMVSSFTQLKTFLHSVNTSSKKIVKDSLLQMIS